MALSAAASCVAGDELGRNFVGLEAASISSKITDDTNCRSLKSLQAGIGVKMGKEFTGENGFKTRIYELFLFSGDTEKVRKETFADFKTKWSTTRVIAGVDFMLQITKGMNLVGGIYGGIELFDLESEGKGALGKSINLEVNGNDFLYGVKAGVEFEFGDNVSVEFGAKADRLKLEEIEFKEINKKVRLKEIAMIGYLSYSYRF